MYLGSWKIDDYLTFACNTHRFDTGAATDADTAPSYRVYEDETATPILTGTLALLDSVNTAGLYSERVQLTAASGLEKGKTYTIYLSATVNSVEGTMSHTFQMEAEVDANVVSDKTGYALSSTQTFNVTGNITGNLSGSVGSVTGAVGSVTGAVGSVTGNVGGNVTGSVGSLVGHTVQTGDSFTRIGATGSGLTSLAAAATALTNVTWTDAKAAFIDHSIATVDTNLDTLLTRITAARAGYLDNLSAGAVALASALATAQADLDKITGTDGVTLATLQALYAPNKVVPDVAGTAAGLHSTTDGKVDTVDANVDSILLDTGTTIPGTITTMQGNVTDILLDTGTTIPGTITTLQTDSTAIKAKTDNLPDGIKKNTAITAFTFLMVDSTDHVTAKTGLTVAGNYSGDGGAVAALTNTAVITEISNGLYEIDLTAGELNYENVTLIFTASGADARVITIHTST